MHLKDATLLVVDDEPYYCEIAKDWFEREGCRVLIAENGFEALSVLEKDKAHAIVTDIRMPRMDGVELVRKLKAKGGYTPTAVALTGFSDLPPREAFDLGIEAQLSKPVSRKVLIEAVQRALTDREELWEVPLHPWQGATITAKFDSLQSALEEQMIAFGRGGFCLKSELNIPEDSGIEFRLLFEVDQKALAGQGQVRWTSVEEHTLGIEITRVDDDCRLWLAQITRENKTLSFIPRTPDARVPAPKR